jgi:hypothetical protein
MIARRSDWRRLLDLALPALDYVFQNRDQAGQAAPDGVPDWTLGGGTAVMLQIGHRISHDIGIFVPGTKLKAFTPAADPAAALISPRCQWPGHYLKVERPEGEIDFLSAGLLTEPGFTWRDLGGRLVALETPEEVIVKKIRYRSESFTARDTFDLAAVSAARPGLEEVLAAEVDDALPRLVEALRVLRAKGTAALAASIVPVGMGVALLPQTFDLAQAAVDRAAGIIREKPEPVRKP